MSHASLRSLRRGLYSALLAFTLAFGSLAPAFAADPPPANTNGAPTVAVAATVVSTVVAPPTGTPIPAGSSSLVADEGSPGEEATVSLLPSIGTAVVTTAVATAKDVPPAASPTLPASATPTVSATAAASVTATASASATATATASPVARSGNAEAGAAASIEQYNIQIIQGTPNPTGPVTQSATNDIVANQRAAATSGVATGGEAQPAGPTTATTSGQPTPAAADTASSGGVLAVAAAVVRQINIQVITSSAGQGTITQTASNSVVLNQDVTAQSGNAAASGSGSAVAGDAKASAVTSQTQVNAQIYVGTPNGPLTADEVIGLVMGYLSGTTPLNGGGQNVTQTAKDTAQVNQQVSAAVQQTPTGTSGTVVAAAKAPSAGSPPPAAAGNGANGQSGGSSLTGDALITALVFVGQINVQLISGLFGNGQAIQSASNTLNVNQALAAMSGSATAANGGSAKSGGAKIDAQVNVGQLNAQVTLSGVGAGAAAAAQSEDDVISAIINLLFRSAALGETTVVRQEASNSAVVDQTLRIPPTPAPESKPPPGAVQNPGSSDSFVSASPPSCRFVHGFKKLHDAIPNVIGECRTDETHAANGDAVQLTMRGILVWRKADNFTAFTDGQRTWVLGPSGVQETSISVW